MTIAEANLKDAAKVAQLARMMWHSHTIEELESDFIEIIEDKDAALFIASEDGHIVGFSQCQLRYDYVEGTSSSPVGYLEGVFISAEYRRKGYAKELIKHCEKWSLEKDCKEFASDCELTNEASLAFHLGAGFTEANRIICFTKQL